MELDFSRTASAPTQSRRTLRRGPFEVITADKLGMKEAWISEHVSRTKGSRRTPCRADMFIVKAAAMTKKIMLGPGVRPIAITTRRSPLTPRWRTN